MPFSVNLDILIRWPTSFLDDNNREKFSVKQLYKNGRIFHFLRKEANGKKIKGITSVKIFKRSEQSIDNDIQLFHFTCNYEIDVSLEFARKRIN